MKMAELAYDIEQLYIEGFSPKTIAIMLECPIDFVWDWMKAYNVESDPQEEIA